MPWGGKFNGASALIDNALDAIERENPVLKNNLQHISEFRVDDHTMAELINLFSSTDFSKPMYNGQPISLSAKDILGHVYEYFLGKFAMAEGQRGGEFFTPKSIVSLIVEMLEPYQGRVYDPAMGSGGFFVQTDRFIQEHQGKRNAVSIFGQEANLTTYRLAIMNMAIRGIEANFELANTLTTPRHLD